MNTVQPRNPTGAAVFDKQLLPAATLCIRSNCFVENVSCRLICNTNTLFTAVNASVCLNNQLIACLSGLAGSMLQAKKPLIAFFTDVFQYVYKINLTGAGFFSSRRIAQLEI